MNEIVYLIEKLWPWLQCFLITTTWLTVILLLWNITEYLERKR